MPQVIRCSGKNLRIGTSPAQIGGIWWSAVSSPIGVWSGAPEANASCVDPPPPPQVCKNCTKNRSRLGSHRSSAQPICMFKAPINRRDNVPNAWLISIVVLKSPCSSLIEVGACNFVILKKKKKSLNPSKKV